MTNFESKVKMGDVVLFEGTHHKVISISPISHPEQLIGGERATPGVYVQLEPLEENVEEPGGWINQARIKKITKGKETVITTDSGDWIGPFHEQNDAANFGSLFGDAFEWYIELYKPEEMEGKTDNPIKFANIYQDGYKEGLNLRSPSDYLALPEDHPVFLIEDWVNKNCTKYGGKIKNKKCVFIPHN